MVISFSKDSLKSYIDWERKNKQAFKNLNKILLDMLRHPFSGLGKPEPLKHQLQGAWSRRIDAKNRIVYMVHGDQILILTCADHYSDT